jgi:hypothetical protein
MAIPRYIQDKIDSYIAELENRYPLSAISYKISIGYAKAGDAAADLVPASTIYTDDDLSPDIGSIIYTDSGKTIVLAGGDAWYHAFESDGTDLSYIISVDNLGVVGAKTLTK